MLAVTPIRVDGHWWCLKVRAVEGLEKEVMDETKAGAERVGGKQMRPSHLSEGVVKRPLGSFSFLVLVVLGLCCV